MKLRNSLLGVAVASLVWATPALANCGKCEAKAHKEHHKQNQTSTSGSTRQSSVRLSKLMESNVITKDGKNLGQLQDLLIDPQTGKIQFAVLGQSGFPGANAQERIPIPWSAVKLQSEKQFTLNVDQDKLQSAPRLSQDLSNLQDPGYAVTIYRFYAVPSDAVGGSEDLEGNDSASQDNNSRATDEMNSGSDSSDESSESSSD